jgi:hypothetical protein
MLEIEMMKRMSRREIQALAKLHRVPANLKTESIIDSIVASLASYQSSEVSIFRAVFLELFICLLIAMHIKHRRSIIYAMISRARRIRTARTSLSLSHLKRQSISFPSRQQSLQSHQH